MVRAAASPQAGLHPRHQDILALQRSAGNAATAALLARQRPPTRPAAPASAPLPVQRRVSVRGLFDSRGTYREVKSLDTSTEQLITEVDQKTDQARLQVINRPMFTGLDELVRTDGHVDLWVRSWRTAASSPLGIYPGQAASEYGYAVESLTTHLLGGSAAGWALSYQIAAGSTRPDIVATKGSVTAWLDLTADSAMSQRHIYTSKRWHDYRVCPYPHAEIVYPPVDLGAMGIMLANARLELKGKPPSSTINTKSISKRIKEAREKRERRVDKWKQRFGPAFGTKLQGVGKHRKSADPEGAARAGVLRYLSVAGVRELVEGNVEDMRVAASVVVCLGRTPKTYGLQSWTGSRALGIAYLEKYAKTLTQ